MSILMRKANCVAPASLVSHAKIYNRFGPAMLWHVGKQHSTGDNGCGQS